MESKRRDGFEEVYRECRAAVYRAALLITRNPEDAEDIAQEAFVRYFIHSMHKKTDRPKSWLVVVAGNLAKNHVKHGRFERLLTEEEDPDRLLPGAPDTEDIFFENMWRCETLEYTDRILGAVRAKNSRWYDALIYAYCMEMPRQEVADCMGITLDALMSMLTRAKKWIRKHYREEYDRIRAR